MTMASMFGEAPSPLLTWTDTPSVSARTQGDRKSQLRRLVDMERLSEAETMRYAQVEGGQKLHLVMEAGEEDRGEVIRAGRLSLPLCGRPVPANGYRMTINVPLSHACRSCLRVERLRR